MDRAREKTDRQGELGIEGLGTGAAGAGASAPTDREPVQRQAAGGLKDDFDRELEKLMAAEPEGKKGKKKKKKKALAGQSGARPKWSRKKKLLAAAGGLAVLCIAGKGFFGGGKETAPLVATQALALGSVQDRLAVTGPVSGTDSVDVVSNLHAEVLELKVKEGERVEKDQLLAVVDSADLEKELEIAQNAYDLAVVTKEEKQREAERGYDKALQDIKTAQDALDRTAVMVQAGDQAPVALEEAQNTYADALRAADAFRLVDGKPVADESYDLQIRNAAFELDKKREDLESAQIKSPIAGTVVRVNTKVGQFADKPEDEKPMFIIENLDQLELEIKISEYSIGKVKEGQPVTISADILGGSTVEGTVSQISPTGEEKGGGSTERVIPTTIKIQDKDTKLIAGITAKAEIVLEEAVDAFVVPASSVLQLDDGSLCLQKVAEGKIHQVPIETGVEGDIMIEVIPAEGEELLEGDQIVITASPMYTEGMAVTVMGGNAQ